MEAYIISLTETKILLISIYANNVDKKYGTRFGGKKAIQSFFDGITDYHEERK